MMNAVIIEDERSNATRLAKLLEKAAPEIKIIGFLESVEDAQNWFVNNAAPDIVFMDVQLSDGLCFEIFESVSIEAPIIFTTAYDEYALNAFRVNSVDYLLKPVDPDELKRALDKFYKFFAGRKGANDNLEALIRNLSQNRMGFRNRLLVKHRNSFISIRIEEIAYIILQAQMVYVYTSGAEKFAVDLHLEELEKSLDPVKFFRINRQIIVSIHSVARIIDYPGNRLKVLSMPEYDGEMIVSREKAAAFKEWMNS